MTAQPVVRITPGPDRPWTDEQVAEFKAALAEAAGGGHYVILPPSEGALLEDAQMVTEVRHLPDGTDEVNWVQVTVRADVRRDLPPGLGAKLLEVVRANWPATEGWERQ